MEEPRIIKKYPNRRLYDTAISRYITLDEVKALVIKRVAFKILDDRTAKDMTNPVLMQILVQEESGAAPLFTREILKNLICFYGNPLQQAISQFLEKGLLLFADSKTTLNDYLQQGVAGQDDTLNNATAEVKPSLQQWSTLLEQFLAKNFADHVKQNVNNASSSE